NYNPLILQIFKNGVVRPACGGGNRQNSKTNIIKNTKTLFLRAYFSRGDYMDYAGFVNFPFPNGFGGGDGGAEKFFYSLSDEAQLKLLGGCESFDCFYARVLKEMQKT
ncbi:MAG: hypothetical protein RR895_08705, partial [Hydrogenoanaerobacterium sp.]